MIEMKGLCTKRYESGISYSFFFEKGGEVFVKTEDFETFTVTDGECNTVKDMKSSLFHEYFKVKSIDISNKKLEIDIRDAMDRLHSLHSKASDIRDAMDELHLMVEISEMEKLAWEKNFPFVV